MCNSFVNKDNRKFERKGQMSIYCSKAFVLPNPCPHHQEDDFIPPSSSFSLPLEHAFVPGDVHAFQTRGSIVLKSIKSSTAALAREVSLASEEHDLLRKAAQENGIYRIRTPSKIGEKLTPDSEDYVSTFVKACHLYQSQLRETITVSIDNSGNVIGLALQSPKGECNADKQLMDLQTTTLNTTVLVDLQVPGTVPDTQTFIKRLEKAEAEKAAGKGKDNRSFLGKYWMYIVPVVLIMMLAGQQDAPEGGGGGGGQ